MRACGHRPTSVAASPSARQNARGPTGSTSAAIAGRANSTPNRWPSSNSAKLAREACLRAIEASAASSSTLSSSCRRSTCGAPGAIASTIRPGGASASASHSPRNDASTAGSARPFR